MHRPGVRAQEGAETAPTRTVIGDLLMIDRDLYIVRGEGGEIHIEATARTEVTEDFQFGDRIKAVVRTNNKALKIERAAPRDVPGVVENQHGALRTFCRNQPARLHQLGDFLRIADPKRVARGLHVQRRAMGPAFVRSGHENRAGR